MDLERKRQEALKFLASTGISRSNYAPPLLHLLWRVGFDVPPPHFSTFGKNMIVTAIWVALSLGLIGSLFRLDSPLASFVKASFGGLIVGIITATYYAYGRHKHKIPTWEEFDHGCENS